MKRLRRKSFIPVASMSDIAFLLLIFLMVTSLTTSQKTSHITLPKIEQAAKENIKKSINLFIDKNEKYYLDDKEMDLAKINDQLETSSAFNKNMTVFLYGDEETEFQYVDQIIQVLKNNRLCNCIFVTKRNNNNSPQRR